MSCYRQTCTQTITGRYMEYWRALKVIQNEEYLMVTDLDIIQRMQNGGVQVNSDILFQKLGTEIRNLFQWGCGFSRVGYWLLEVTLSNGLNAR